jgi:hypothetical protein
MTHTPLTLTIPGWVFQVRDLFERATAAKPCVLFFDEFDSIAPKRSVQFGWVKRNAHPFLEGMTAPVSRIEL